MVHSRERKPFKINAENLNRERIPERVVHPRGAGAYGTFSVTKAI